jgi:hypothetical protein
MSTRPKFAPLSSRALVSAHYAKGIVWGSLFEAVVGKIVGAYTIGIVDKF